jgi:hypothetical protein
MQIAILLKCVPETNQEQHSDLSNTSKCLFALSMCNKCDVMVDGGFDDDDDD